MSPTIGGALRIARSTLAKFLEDHEADKEARMILGHVTGRSQASLLAESDKMLDGAAHRDLKKALVARQNRQPLSQVLGSTEFYGRCFSVTPDVLTPRSDTETLIEVALSAPFARVLDLGTGSGCILATLLAERPAATGVGTDISDAALGIASSNLAASGLQDRATLRKSDWFTEVDGQFDLIVSNPPYIAVDELPDLAPEVRDWEPHLACPRAVTGLAHTA